MCIWSWRNCTPVRGTVLKFLSFTIFKHLCTTADSRKMWNECKLEVTKALPMVYWTEGARSPIMLSIPFWMAYQTHLVPRLWYTKGQETPAFMDMNFKHLWGYVKSTHPGDKKLKEKQKGSNNIQFSTSRWTISAVAPGTRTSQRACLRRSYLSAVGRKGRAPFTTMLQYLRSSGWDGWQSYPVRWVFRQAHIYLWNEGLNLRTSPKFPRQMVRDHFENSWDVNLVYAFFWMVLWQHCV